MREMSDDVLLRTNSINQPEAEQPLSELPIRRGFCSFHHRRNLPIRVSNRAFRLCDEENNNKLTHFPCLSIFAHFLIFPDFSFPRFSIIRPAGF